MVLQISNEGDDRMGVKIKTPQKIPRAYNKTPKKSLDQILTPEESYAKFPGQVWLHFIRRTTRPRIFRLF